LSKGLNTSHIYALMTACSDLADWIRLHHPQHVRLAESNFLTAWDTFHDSQTQNRYRRVKRPKGPTTPESLKEPPQERDPDPVPDPPEEPPGPPPT